MRAVLGVVFVVVGIVGGYLVLSGKFPAASSASTDSTASTAGTIPANLNTSPSTAGKGGGPGGGGLIGIPTVKHMMDLGAARGDFS